MPPNKSRTSRRNKDYKSSASSGDETKATTKNDGTSTDILTFVSGNEKRSNDIFVDIEQAAGADLVVTDKPAEENSDKQVEQQVEDSGHPSAIQNDGHIVINVEPEQNTDDPSSVQKPSPKDISIEDEDEDSLSATLTRLTTPNGAEVFLMGTAHFSVRSVQDVRRIIRRIRPSSVILELCRERAFMLSLDEQYLLEQNKTLSLEKVRNAIAEKGIAHGLIYIMFIKMSASLTERLGMAPGAEFRAGSSEAQKIPACSVVLADRSFRITIARAVASVSLWQKLKLIYHVLTTDVNVTQEDVEKFKNKDMLEQLLEELGGEFPGFKRVILDERNIYLAHSIYNWAQSSDTSFGPPKIVALVGIGHVAGIVENWGKTTDGQIQDLIKVPQKSRTEIVVKKTIKYCALALLIYVTYRTCTPSHIQSGIQQKLTEKIFFSHT